MPDVMLCRIVFALLCVPMRFLRIHAGVHQHTLGVLVV